MVSDKRLGAIVSETLNNFLSEYRPFTTNKAKKVSINEVNAKLMLDRHGENGFIVISPYENYEKEHLSQNQSYQFTEAERHMRAVSKVCDEGKEQTVEEVQSLHPKGGKQHL